MPNQMWKLFLSRVEFHFHVDVCWVVTSSGLCLNYKHILHYSLDFIVHTVQKSSATHNPLCFAYKPSVWALWRHLTVVLRTPTAF